MGTGYIEYLDSHCFCDGKGECIPCIRRATKAARPMGDQMTRASLADIEDRLSNLERAIGQMFAAEIAGSVSPHPMLGPAMREATLEAGKSYLLITRGSAPRIVTPKMGMTFTADTEGDLVAEIVA